MRLISKRALSKHGGQTCPPVSGSSLLSVLEMSECQQLLWDPRKLDQNGFVVWNSPTPCFLWEAVCTAWSQRACLFTCKSSPSKPVCTQSCGKWIMPQKSYSAFIFQVCDLLLFARVCVLKGRASEKRSMFYIVFVKRAEDENMGKRDDEREREDKQWCITDIGSPCEPWDVWGNGGIMHKMFVTYCRGQFKTLR